MDLKYFQEIPLNALEFLDNLAKKDLNFNPVTKSPTLIGTKLNMGYLCYAIKIHVLTNNWNNLSTTDQQHYIEKLKNYQKSDYFTYKNYFIDDHLLKDFLLILALINTSLIFLLFNSEIIMGQISDSTKMTEDGSQ